MGKTESVVNLDPAKVQAEYGNVRYGLLPHRIEALAESIVEHGGIHTPVIVEKLTPPTESYTHRLRVGFYRHAVALKLNTEQKAGLTLPAIVREGVDLRAQISENVDRENMSPMDTATAMHQALGDGLSREVVRKLFQRPGGRKGVQMQPLSNSSLNIYLSFLDLPKGIQTKIHDGRLPVSTAMVLVKVPPEQREEVLAKAEEARQRAIEREEKDAWQEGKAAEREGKAAEREQAKVAKVTTAQAGVDKATVALASAEQAHTEAVETHKAASRVGPTEERLGKEGSPLSFSEWPEAEKRLFAERKGAAKLAQREAEKTLSKAKRDATNAANKLHLLTRQKIETPVEAKPEKKATPKKAGRVQPSDVQKAAKASGVGDVGPMALSAAEARAAAGELAKSRFPKVKAIGSIFVKVLSGALTPKSAETDLSVITGERKTTKA